MWRSPLHSPSLFLCLCGFASIDSVGVHPVQNKAQLYDLLMLEQRKTEALLRVQRASEEQVTLTFEALPDFRLVLTGVLDSNLCDRRWRC